MSTRNTDRINRSMPTKPHLVFKAFIFSKWQAAEASVLPESVWVPLAALSRSSEGLTVHWHPWKRLGMADGMACGPEPVPYWSGMAPISWQSAPNAVAAPLRGQPHRTVSGQATGDSQISHG